MVDKDLEFKVTPGEANTIVDRDAVLISLHPDMSDYIGSIHDKARPIDVTIMEYKGKYHEPSRGKLNGLYMLVQGWGDTLGKFVDNFTQRYPEVEQIYLVPAYTRYDTKERSCRLPCSLLGEELRDVIFKRFLVLPVNPAQIHESHIGDLPSNKKEIVKAVEKSLRFSSW